jgi:protocatechuate 3,4-dioxygenase beta subunit
MRLALRFRTALLILLAGFLVAPAVRSVAAGPGATSPPPVLTLVAAGEPGRRVSISGQVVDTAGEPVPGAELHVYQTDARGHYTPDRPMDEPHARLSGRLQADGQGRFELHTIRPGGYPKAIRLGDRDRKIPAHIHIDVSAAGYSSHKFQAVFADDPLLSDPYWQDWVKRLGQPVLSVSHQGSAESASLKLVLHRTDAR